MSVNKPRMSTPERLATGAIKRLCLPFTQNDGTRNPIKINFREDRRGTSIIYNGRLLFDVRNPSKSRSRPKNYTYIRPDYLWSPGCLVEIKGSIGGDTWEALSRDVLNDNIRFALIRMRAGNIPDMTAEYEELNADTKLAVNEELANLAKANPKDRVYLKWSALMSVVSSPNDNLRITSMSIQGRDLPIKVIAGLEKSRLARVYIVDYEILALWNDL